MSKAGVIASLVIALVLAVVAAVVLPEPKGIVRSRQLLSFHPSEVRALHVRVADGREQVVERAADGVWYYVWADGKRWPINRTNIDGALRMLSALSGEREAEVGDRAGWNQIEIELNDGGAWRMSCSPTVLGGARAVRVEGPGGEVFSANVQGEVLTALFETGLGPWRVMRALPELSLNISRVGLETPTGSIQLVRLGERWRMIEPRAVAADGVAVQALLRRLAAVKVIRFIQGDTDREELGLDEPIARAVIERQLAPGSQTGTGTSARRVDRRTLTVGGAANVEATRVFAEIRQQVIAPDGTVEAESSVIVETDTRAFDGILAGAAGFISRHAAEVPASEVGAVTICFEDRQSRLDLTIDGWVRRVEDGPSERVLLEEEELIRALLTLLCETDASKVQMVEGEQTDRAFEIELGSLSGQPLERMRVRFDNDTGEIIVGSSGVRWAYDGQAAGAERLMAWLAREIGGADAGGEDSGGGGDGG